MADNIQISEISSLIFSKQVSQIDRHLSAVDRRRAFYNIQKQQEQFEESLNGLLSEPEYANVRKEVLSALKHEAETNPDIFNEIVKTGASKEVIKSQVAKIVGTISADDRQNEENNNPQNIPTNEEKDSNWNITPEFLNKFGLEQEEVEQARQAWNDVVNAGSEAEALDTVESKMTGAIKGVFKDQAEYEEIRQLVYYLSVSAEDFPPEAKEQAMALITKFNVIQTEGLKDCTVEDFLDIINSLRSLSVSHKDIITEAVVRHAEESAKHAEEPVRPEGESSRKEDIDKLESRVPSSGSLENIMDLKTNSTRPIPVFNEEETAEKVRITLDRSKDQLEAYIRQNKAQLQARAITAQITPETIRYNEDKYNVGAFQGRQNRFQKQSLYSLNITRGFVEESTHSTEYGDVSTYMEDIASSIGENHEGQSQAQKSTFSVKTIINHLSKKGFDPAQISAALSTMAKRIEEIDDFSQEAYTSAMQELISQNPKQAALVELGALGANSAYMEFLGQAYFDLANVVEQYDFRIKKPAEREFNTDEAKVDEMRTFVDKAIRVRLDKTPDFADIVASRDPEGIPEIGETIDLSKYGRVPSFDETYTDTDYEQIAAGYGYELDIPGEEVAETDAPTAGYDEPVYSEPATPEAATIEPVEQVPVEPEAPSFESVQSPALGIVEQIQNAAKTNKEIEDSEETYTAPTIEVEENTKLGGIKGLFAGIKNFFQSKFAKKEDPKQLTDGGARIANENNWVTTVQHEEQGSIDSLQPLSSRFGHFMEGLSNATVGKVMKVAQINGQNTQGNTIPATISREQVQPDRVQDGNQWIVPENQLNRTQTPSRTQTGELENTQESQSKDDGMEH